MRRRWFRVAAMVLIPLALFVTAEVGLRLAGYGYPTGFFRPLTIDRRDYLVQNDQFGYRFFPPDLARTPATLRLAPNKPAATYRIFIFGESAALGDPEPAYGAGRYLEVLLRARYPQAHFEVINTAMTAINSHALLPIARDCAGLHGDLWIIYAGNNEMVGPFGAATVFGMKAPPVRWVRLNLALQATRLGQLATAAGRRLHATGKAPAVWGGMSMFTGNELLAEDPRREVVYRNFDCNLRDMLRTGLESGAQVLLCTMPVNEADCPPFASGVSPRLGPTASNQVMQALAAGKALAAAGDHGGAVKAYQSVETLTPACADLAYATATSLAQLHQWSAARSYYQKAVDWDELPFRADSRINEIIRNAAKTQANSAVTLLESETPLTGGQTNVVPGNEVFYEHVHLNFNGNYRLARAWAEEVARTLPTQLKQGGGQGWAEQPACEQSLALTPFDRAEVQAEVIRRFQLAPLSHLANQGEELKRYQAQLAQAQAATHEISAEQIQTYYREALAAAPADNYLLEHYATCLQDQQQWPAAAEQWQKYRAAYPQDHTAYYQLGRIAIRQQDLVTARSQLQQAVAIHPSFSPGWFELGNAAAAAGDYQGSLAEFDQALKYDPGYAAAWFAKGLALAMLGNKNEAMLHYRQAVKYDPGHWQAHYQLGGLLGQQGKMQEAADESAAAVRLHPEFPTAHLNLGLACVQLGRYREAEEEFKTTLQLEPGNAKAADYLAQTQALIRQHPEPASPAPFTGE
ncbi:MAG TPA: tetratricopeptide repeat protein [Verrucomicrobiae bacterium]